jgi:NAD(P)-dependent dehydrogenase (short-subunit alcohol dehydrogenase family)
MIESPVALVTGANKGLGQETARQLAERGATVVLGSRDPDLGDVAASDLRSDGLAVTSVQLDVTDAASVERVAAQLSKDHGRLDILVNNAGILVDSPALSTTAAEMRTTFETNLFGVVTVIHTMLPLLRASTAPRIVNVASTTASLALISQEGSSFGDSDRILAYAPSKTAVNMLTVQYAQAFRRDPRYGHFKVNSATPGYIATDFNNHSGPRTAAQGARVVVQLAMLPDDGPTGGFFNDEGALPW